MAGNVSREQLEQFFAGLQIDDGRIPTRASDVLKAVYVAAEYKGTEVVGIAGIRIQRGLPLPSLFVAVRKDYRKRGIGERLVRQATDYSLTHYGFVTLSTHRDPKYAGARRLYEKLQYRYLPIPGAQYWMFKTL